MKCRCKHFTGIQNKTCDAGVNYDTVVQRVRGLVPPCWPCITESVDTCIRRSLMTADDFAAEEAQTEEAVQRVLLARAAIVAKEGNTRNIAHEMECPIDGGILRYRIAGNGHIRASCSTPDCVRWIE